MPFIARTLGGKKEFFNPSHTKKVEHDIGNIAAGMTGADYPRSYYSNQGVFQARSSWKSGDIGSRAQNSDKP